MAKQDLKLDGMKVVLGVSGGIAAYKAIDLASKLTANSAEVRTVLTENALQLVGAKSFEAVTGGPVHTSMWEQQEFKIGHVNLADWADLIVIAPATANIIGKFAHGICDDLHIRALSLGDLLQSLAAVQLLEELSRRQLEGFGDSVVDLPPADGKSAAQFDDPIG